MHDDILSDDFETASAEAINRAKLSYGQPIPNDNPTGAGVAKTSIEYVAQLLQARSMIDQDGNRGFFLDCVVAEPSAAPHASPVGFEFTEVWYPDAQKKFKAKKEGQLKANVGALFGFDAAGSTTGVTRQTIVQTFVDVGSKDDPINQGVYTPLRGRLLRVQASPVWGKQKAHWTTKMAFRPHLVDGQPVTRAVQAVAPAAAPAAAGPGVANTRPAAAAPAVPSPPAAPAFPPTGWLPHPAAPGWFYEAANPNNQKTEAQLRAA